MNSKNIGPIIQRLFQRSAVAAVVIFVVVVFLAANNVSESSGKLKLRTIEELKRNKDHLVLDLGKLNNDRTDALSRIDESKKLLADAKQLIESQTLVAQKAIHDAREAFDRKVEAARNEYTAAQRAIEAAVDSIKQDLDRARAAAEKVQEVIEEGSYAWAWISKWGKSWDDYLAQKERAKQAQEERKNKAQKDCDDALKRYTQAKADAAQKQKEAQDAYEQKEASEQSELKVKQSNANEIERAAKLDFSEKEQERDSFTKKLEAIDYEKEKLESRIAEIDQTLAQIPVWQRLQSEAWIVFRNHWGAIISGAIFIIFPVGRWLRRLFVWFGPGAWVERRRKPLVFSAWRGGHEAVTTGSNGVSLVMQVKEGEAAWFRDEYLDRTTRPTGTRFGLLPVFSKRFLLMSLIDGLWWMTVVKGDKENKTKFTVSATDDAASEFAVVEIPEQSSLLIRPRFIIGLTFPEQSPPKLRKHWRLTQLEAWCIGQLWFFELAGPARVVLRGSRGVLSHSSVSDESIESRLNPGSLIGFSPTVTLSIRRSESLWQYLANEAPFYNYSFEGNGTFLTQETQEKSSHGGPLGWLASLGDALLKLAGF
jgi:hypothetical protein